MSEDTTPTTPTTPGQQYSAAHIAHYVTKDLPRALEHYAAILADHPDSPEAGYSRAQVKNITNTVVPKDEIVASQLEMTRSHLQSQADE